MMGKHWYIWLRPRPADWRGRWVGVLVLGLALLAPAEAWQAKTTEAGMAYELDGEMVAGEAETSGRIYLSIGPERVLPVLNEGQRYSYRKIILNYGDSYICGFERFVKFTIDGRLVREDDARDDWHILRKGFLDKFFGEVLSYESYQFNDRQTDLASKMLAAHSEIRVERKLDDCGDSAVFVFTIDSKL